MNCLKAKIKERKEYRESLRKEIRTLFRNDNELCNHTLVEIIDLIRRVFNINIQINTLTWIEEDIERTTIEESKQK